MPYLPYAEQKSLFRDRPWVVVFGTLLASVAGYVNVVMLGVYHVPVSHMTGAVSRLAIDLSNSNHSDLQGAFAIFAGFLGGAVLSGLIIGSTQIRPGRRYGIAMMVEGGLICLAGISLLYRNNHGITLAAMACGLQNAMASSYYGLIIRTTHVSGIVTDIGVLIGHLLRYRRIAVWKLLVLTSLLSGFFTGGLLGGIAYNRIGLPALFLAAIGCMTAGVCYHIWRRRHLDELVLDKWGIPSPDELT